MLFLVFTEINGDAVDDQACASLKPEFESICSQTPDPQAVAETKAFCDAFRQSCHHLLIKEEGTKAKINVLAYCNRHRERFRFVCPDPTRFKKYSSDAIEFCNRYQSFCPNEALPSKPQPFQPKRTNHIYIREHQYICDLHDDFAKVYCHNPVILKVPIYQFLCLQYKQHCIDKLTQVIYYGYHP
uniref:Uncharacterized protein n=1 Tax=Acrobeloides nanus TaxID=290746 RepID=A0A914E061_9BILA